MWGYASVACQNADANCVRNDETETRRVMSRGKTSSPFHLLVRGLLPFLPSSQHSPSFADGRCRVPIYAKQEKTTYTQRLRRLSRGSACFLLQTSFLFFASPLVLDQRTPSVASTLTRRTINDGSASRSRSSLLDVPHDALAPNAKHVLTRRRVDPAPGALVH